MHTALNASASPFPEPDAFPLPEFVSQTVRPAAPIGRMAVAAAILTTVLLSANAFVCATWSHFFGWPGWILWQAIPGALVVAFVGTTILGFRFSNPLVRFSYTVSATWLAGLNFAFFRLGRLPVARRSRAVGRLACVAVRPRGGPV